MKKRTAKRKAKLRKPRPINLADRDGDCAHACAGYNVGEGFYIAIWSSRGSYPVAHLTVSQARKFRDRLTQYIDYLDQQGATR